MELQIFDSIKSHGKEDKELYSVRSFLLELGYGEATIYNNWSQFKEGILQKCLDLSSLLGIDLQEHFLAVKEKTRGNKKGDYLFSARLLALVAMEADSNLPRVQQYKSLFSALFEQAVDIAKKPKRGRKPKELTDYQRLVVLERQEEKDSTKGLRKTAINHGMSDYATFWNAGYEIFGEGETASSIREHYSLKKKDNVHDYDNPLIRAVTKAKNEVTKVKIEQERIYGNDEVIKAHGDVGHNFHEALAKDSVFLKDQMLGDNIKPWERVHKREQQTLEIKD